MADPSLQHRFNNAARALGRGDFALARREGEALLRSQPRNPAVLQLLGIACGEAGDPQRGVFYLRQALKIGGDTADNRFNLARILLAAGELDEAEQLAVAGGDDPQFARLHGDILRAKGDPHAAVRSYERLAAEQPGDLAVLNNLGNAKLAAGDLDGALLTLQHARTIDPSSMLVHLNIGRALLSLDRYADACIVFEEAHRLAPDDPLPLIELGRTLTSIDQARAALPALGSAARLDQRDPAIFVAIGRAFADLEEHDQAEKAYRMALHVAPRDSAALLSLGILLEQANRADELAALVRQGSVAGGGAEVDYLRALTLRREGKVAEALVLARRVESPHIDATVLAHLIGQLSDRVGDTGSAWTAYQEMNRAAGVSPLGRSVDRGAYLGGIARLAATTTADWYARWTPPAPTPARPAPVFLVGFPRSGTTLLDTFLLGHSRVHVLEEVPVLQHVADAAGDTSALADLDQATLGDLQQRYFAELDRVAPAAKGKLVVDKNPLSMLRLPLIHRIFPDARIILAMRHPADVVLSCVTQNFKPTDAMINFLDIDSASRAYDRVFAYWEQCHTLLPNPVHTLRYEAMVADPTAAVRPLVDFIGLEWEEAILDHQRTAIDRGHIRTPSYAQVTEPVYDRAAGRWRRYRDQMRWALPVLAPWAERYGYSLD